MPPVVDCCLPKNESKPKEPSNDGNGWANIGIVICTTVVNTTPSEVG